MGLALVMVEEHARRTVQLGHDHALGAVDHEGAVLGHERQFAHVDFLLFHFLRAAVLDRRFLVIEREAHQHAQRRGIGEAAHDAFLHVERRLAELVLDIFQRRVARIARDREHRLEGRMQADVGPLLGSLVLLQELQVGFELDGQKIGDFQDARPFAKVLADAFLLGERISHLRVPRRSPHSGGLYRSIFQHWRAALGGTAPSHAKTGKGRWLPATSRFRFFSGVSGPRRTLSLPS